jgi:molybdenum cofactor biosynthesis enzyme MoaA
LHALAEVRIRPGVRKLGGGEPFLRADLADILLAAHTRNDVANVYVPTNGQHTARTINSNPADQLQEIFPRRRLSVDRRDEAE